MSNIPWTRKINFSSALLLHSCVTILLKEAINLTTIVYRVGNRYFRTSTAGGCVASVQTSIVLDAYTSVLSRDAEGEQAELYFTNTGVLLLAASLTSSLVMNLFLSDFLLNMLVAGTFGLCFLASLVLGHRDFTLPIMALRRAGRFIWSDTPFVNFFTLIYIATALRGSSVLRLQDYVIFRCIAVLELVFMKGKLAASDPAFQQKLVERLMESEWILSHSATLVKFDFDKLPDVSRDDIVAFNTSQRLGVMLLKTSVGYDNGCLAGVQGPRRCPLPVVGKTVTNSQRCLTIVRPNLRTIILVDCLEEHVTRTNLWTRFIAHAHGFLLRRIGKVRVVYAMQTSALGTRDDILCFHSNINMVTGVDKKWLEEFPEGEIVGQCLVAG